MALGMLAPAYSPSTLRLPYSAIARYTPAHERRRGAAARGTHAKGVELFCDWSVGRFVSSSSRKTVSTPWPALRDKEVARALFALADSQQAAAWPGTIGGLRADAIRQRLLRSI